MKLNAILTTLLMAAAASLSVGAYAADADKTPAAEPQTAKPAADAMKPHSHMQEKTGVAPQKKMATDAKTNAAKDKSKHLHPRDAK